MKLASLQSERDGRLLVVSRDLTRAVSAESIAPTMQAALDDWARCSPRLAELSERLQANLATDSFPFNPRQVMAPLPRCYHWADGSAYVTHVELVRKARGADLPASFWTDPLMYMGASDAFIAAHDPIVAENEAWGIDFEAEIAIITDDVPTATTEQQAGDHIKLIMLVNDVSLRNLIPAELAKQFGFYQSKPWTSCSPVAITPDELGTAWDGARVHLPLSSTLNGKLIGEPNAGVDMVFSFPQLIAHAARTRALTAGTVIGSGTVANKGSTAGSSCLAEVRCLEIIVDGKPSTPFMSFGDRIEIDMLDATGHSICGRIDQIVLPLRSTPAAPADHS